MAEINKEGIELIKHFESLHDGDLTKVGLQPKLCPAGIWTVGYGRALINPITHKFLYESDKEFAYKIAGNITEIEAEQMLKEDMIRYSNRLDKQLGSVKNKLNNNQYSALVSFVYNCGDGNFATSILKKKILVNPNDSTISLEFGKWNKALIKGVLTPLNGLSLRRSAESRLYFTPTK